MKLLYKNLGKEQLPVGRLIVVGEAFRILHVMANDAFLSAEDQELIPAGDADFIDQFSAPKGNPATTL